jgi:diguanylate cyclase (GGDEF)-like protein
MNIEIDRNGFRQAIESAISECAQNKYIAVVVVKLHDLHKINTIHGYDQADKILLAAFESLNNSVKKASTVCRLSSSNFGLIVRDLKFPHLIQIGLDKALNAVGGPFLVNNEEVLLKVTAGTSLYPPDGDSADQLFMRAETALLSSGATGKQVSLFEDTQDKSDNDQWQLEADLKIALLEQQLDVHYQPQIRLEDDSTAGFEALLRWQHPVHGPISPHVFVGLAESRGMIDDLTEWVLQTALRETSLARKGSETVTVSVNISPLTLFDPGFLYAVDSAVSLWGTTHEQLTIEITEGVFIDDFEASKKLLNKLRSKGVRVSIDDFGTGYSSLAYFKKLPADELKIDQSFITKMVQNTEDQNLVEVIIELAHKFSLTVVAEGIEDLETLNVLREIGCDMAQGFYISKALEADRLQSWAEGKDFSGTDKQDKNAQR